MPWATLSERSPEVNEELVGVDLFIDFADEDQKKFWQIWGLSFTISIRTRLSFVTMRESCGYG
jgi:hypothetical protein